MIFMLLSEGIPECQVRLGQDEGSFEEIHGYRTIAIFLKLV
jgi:hypothetical protein